jgi:hypothetical protein
MQQTHGQNGASLLILVLSGPGSHGMGRLRGVKPTVATAGAACLLTCLIALGCRTRDTLVYPGVSLKIAMLTPAAGSTISRSIDRVPVRATITYITPRDGGGLLIVNVLDKDNLVDGLGTSERSYELPAGATGTVEYSDTIVVTPSVRTVRLSAFLLRGHIPGNPVHANLKVR